MRKSMSEVETTRLSYDLTCLFCRILSLLQGSFAKETYSFIDLINQSHPIETTRLSYDRT